MQRTSRRFIDMLAAAFLAVIAPAADAQRGPLIRPPAPIERPVIAPRNPIAAAPGSPAVITGSWNVNANGFVGRMEINQAADGSISGALFGDPIMGAYAPGARTLVFWRGVGGSLAQAFVMQVWSDGRRMTGAFYALNSLGGASPSRIRFNVVAETMTSTAPGDPGAPDDPADGPSPLASAWSVDANGHEGDLILSESSAGALTGSIFGDRLDGRYAAAENTIVLMRYFGATPSQLYVGSAQGSPQRIDGVFYALHPGAGATAQGLTYAFSAEERTPASGATSRSSAALAALQSLPQPAVLVETVFEACTASLPLTIKAPGQTVGDQGIGFNGNSNGSIIFRPPNRTFLWYCGGLSREASGDSDSTTCPEPANTVVVTRRADNRRFTVECFAAAPAILDVVSEACSRCFVSFQGLDGEFRNVIKPGASGSFCRSEEGAEVKSARIARVSSGALDDEMIFTWFCGHDPDGDGEEERTRCPGPTTDVSVIRTRSERSFTVQCKLN